MAVQTLQRCLQERRCVKTLYGIRLFAFGRDAWREGLHRGRAAIASGSRRSSVHPNNEPPWSTPAVLYGLGAPHGVLRKPAFGERSGARHELLGNVCAICIDADAKHPCLTVLRFSAAKRG